MTRIELAIVIVVIFAFLALLGLPFGPTTATLHRARMMQTLSNMRQLHLLSGQMARDHSTNGFIGEWTCSNGVPLTFAQWTNQLVEGRYLGPEDAVHLVSSRDMAVGINAFAVTASDPTNTLFLATKNWHGIAAHKLSGKPFENRGFVIFRTGGVGTILHSRAATDFSKEADGGKFNYLPLQQ